MLSRGGRLSLSTRRALFVLPIWIVTLIWVWSWWFNPDRIELLWLYIPLTAALFYEFAFLPSAFLFFVLRAKNPPKRHILKNKKVAIITPCVPAQESTEVIERQLKAMSEVSYPHDSWILDEAGSKKIKKLASKYDVKYFSRKGIKKYNQADYPFKTKTKAGNVNAWLDHVKRRKYEFFVQLDVDHAPKPNYLDKTIGHFRDPEVAWVQPPSVYSNFDSWVARGAAEQDFAFQGPLQMGFYGNSEMPMIVGSHCVYRMRAISEIGGFQPTRAEDHLDTLVLASRGWKGVFLPEVIAEGDGPETFGVFLAQQFAWSYSMFQILLRYSPKYLLKMPPRKMLPLLFSETFYPLWSLSYLIMFTAPIIAVALNHDIVKTKPSDLIIHLIPASLATLLIWFAGRPLMQPHGLRLSWRGILLQTIRWPIVLVAILNALFNIKKPYMITPKGKHKFVAPPISLYLPFIVLGFISATVTLISELVYGEQLKSGQIIFTLFNTAFVMTVCVIDLNINMRMAVKKLQNVTMDWLRPIAVISVLLVIFSLAVVSSPLFKDTTALAFVRPTSEAYALDPGILPVSKLTNQQLIDQIATKAEHVNVLPAAVGVHDPTRRFSSNKSYIRHSFVDWRKSRDLAGEILTSERLGAVPLITIEPNGYKNGQALLQGIASGKYDQNLDNIAEVLKNTKQPVYIRFAHEMDLGNVYPWGAQDPQLFIKAYQHVVSHVRAQNTPYVKWVWSPAGNNGSEAYYPGDNVVDIVGTTVLYDRYWSGDFQPTFAQLSEVRQWLTGFGKPVWITEFGVGNADPSFQARLLGDAVNHFKEHGYSALVYLNIDDANLKIPKYIFNDASTLHQILGIDKPRALSKELIKQNISIGMVKPAVQRNVVRIEKTCGVVGDNKNEQKQLLSLKLNIESCQNKKHIDAPSKKHTNPEPIKVRNSKPSGNRQIAPSATKNPAKRPDILDYIFHSIENRL